MIARARGKEVISVAVDRRASVGDERVTFKSDFINIIV